MLNKIVRIISGSSNESKNNGISNISLPTNVVRKMHVSRNHETGDLEVLPKQPKTMVQTLITELEQMENPDAGKLQNFLLIA